MPNLRKTIEPGSRYGLLTVVEHAGMKARGHKLGTISLYRCRCMCGKEKVVEHGNLRSGLTQSCGCGIGKRRRAA